jgi:hypothetical protein
MLEARLNAPLQVFNLLFIVPTLCVGMRFSTLQRCLTKSMKTLERQQMRYNAERCNDKIMDCCLSSAGGIATATYSLQSPIPCFKTTADAVKC